MIYDAEVAEGPERAESKVGPFEYIVAPTPVPTTPLPTPMPTSFYGFVGPDKKSEGYQQCWGWGPGHVPEGWDKMNAACGEATVVMADAGVTVVAVKRDGPVSFVMHRS